MVLFYFSYVFIIIFLYLNFSQDLLTLMPVQLNVPFLSKNKQNQPPPPKKKPSEKDNQPIRMTKKNTKTKQQKRTEPWNLVMLLSYAWAWGLRWHNRANAHMKPETWQHAQGLLQLRTDSWPEKGKWTQSSTLTKKLFTTNTCKERGSLHWRGAGYIFSVWVCHT